MSSLKKRAARVIGGLVPVLAFIVVSTPIEVEARPSRGGGGGAMRGGGGMRAGGGGGMRGGGAPRAASRPSGGGRAQAAQRPSGGGRAQAGARPGAGGGGSQVARGGDRSRVQGGDRFQGGDRSRDVDRERTRNGDVNIGNDIDMDVDGGWDNDWYGHPIAAGVAWGTAAAITTAAIGSVVYSVPPSCETVYYSSVTYSYCGGTWYQPSYYGSSVQYEVVNAPY